MGILDGDVRKMKALQEKIMERLATQTFAGFLKFINKDNPDFVFGKMTEYLCDILEAFERGEIPKLGLFMPPQHTKSSTATEAFVAYYILRDPTRRAMLGSYGKDISEKFGEAILELVLKYGYLFDVEVSNRTRSKTKFNIEGERGGMLSTTIRGGATGFPADLLVIDDPIKGPGDLSKAERDAVHDSYLRVFKTRGSAKRQEIMIMTRWHVDDLAGRVIDDTWKVVSLPAISLGADVDPMGREKGEPLFPEMGKDLAFLEEQRRDLGEKAWQSMYMQNPVVERGIIFMRDWVRYYNQEEFDVTSCEKFYTTWDFNMTAGANSDYAVGQVWGLRNNKFYLLDMIRGQWSRKEAQEKFDYLYEQWGAICDKVLVEKAANGHAILDDRHYLTNLVPIVPTRSMSKYERIELSAVEWENGNVYLPRDEEFSSVLLEEAVGLGQVKNDDAIDACAQLINYVRDKRKEQKKNAVDFSYKVYKR